jgi:hypothetical protein
MKSATAVLVLAGASQLACADDTASPVAKVIDMLAGLQAKIIGEGEEAQKTYDEFAEWCEDTAKQLQFEVKTGKQGVADLQAKIEEETSTIAALNAKVEELAASLAADTADLKAATEIRTKEKSDFDAAEKELMDCVDTLGRAIGILEREMKKSGGASMMQLKSAESVAQALSTMVEASMLSSADSERLTALVQSSQESDEDEAGAPAAAVYEGHSGGILDVLGGLLEKAQTRLDDSRKAESTSVNNFNMLKQSLEDNIKFSNAETDAANKGLAKSGESKAGAEGELAVTSKDLSSDMGTLADTHANCMKKAEEFESETKSRAEELNALAAAKKIISETTGGASAQSYSLLQMHSKISSTADLKQFEAVHAVRDLAKKLNSPALAQLSARLSSAVRLGSVSGGDIFGKIKGLISDMIEKLSQEASDDATEKGFCDKELAYTRGRKAEKENEVAKQTTFIDQSVAKSSQLKEEVATLQKELADLAKSQASWDKFRSEENTVYKKARAEMEEGLNGIKMALKVLRDYYAQKQENAAEGAATGIIGLLEVVESDFSKGLANIIATEESAMATYKQEIKDIEIDRATKEQDSAYKTKEHVSLDKGVTETSSDRAGVNTELDAINKYLGSLEGRCIAKAATYEEIVKRRTAEIAGLKDALEILEGQGVDFSLLQSKRSLRGVHQHA